MCDIKMLGCSLKWGVGVVFVDVVVVVLSLNVFVAMDTMGVSGMIA